MNTLEKLEENFENLCILEACRTSNGATAFDLSQDSEFFGTLGLIIQSTLFDCFTLYQLENITINVDLRK